MLEFVIEICISPPQISLNSKFLVLSLGYEPGERLASIRIIRTSILALRNCSSQH